jgi:two-component system sensor histidine kinase FlrB
MGQHKITSWIDEPAFISSEASRGVISRVSLDSGLDFSEDNSEVFKSELPDQSKVAPAEEALTLFDHLSSQLTSSYRNLENKVSQLKSELSEEETQRRTQFKEKEELANRLSTLLEILPAGVILLDENGVVSECNPAAMDLLGEPLEGQAWLDVIKRSFSPKHDDGHEVSLKDGRRVRIETRSMQSGPGQLVLLSDLTETRLLQEQVSRAERLSSLGKMVASLAHQIRTPLSTAMLYAGHLCQSEIDDSMRVNIAGKMMSRLTHLEHQIRDMLIFAKGETRLAERLPIDEFMSAFRLAAEPILEKAGVECHWDYSGLNKSILCNKETLVGACVNLVNNSIEAGEQKGAHVGDKLNLLVSLVSQGDESVRLIIKDNGPGIPNAQKHKVFEPFYTTKPQGTGLGLAVVQAVVKAHKGVFNVSSSKKGVAAVIQLPVYEMVKINNSHSEYRG